MMQAMMTESRGETGRCEVMKGNETEMRGNKL